MDNECFDYENWMEILKESWRQFLDNLNGNVNFYRVKRS